MWLMSNMLAVSERKEAYSAVVSGWVGRPNRCFKQSSVSKSSKATRRAKERLAMIGNTQIHFICCVFILQFTVRVCKQEVAVVHLTV